FPQMIYPRSDSPLLPDCQTFFSFHLPPSSTCHFPPTPTSSPHQRVWFVETTSSTSHLQLFIFHSSLLSSYTPLTLPSHSTTTISTQQPPWLLAMTVLKNYYNQTYNPNDQLQSPHRQLQALFRLI